MWPKRYAAFFSKAWGPNPVRWPMLSKYVVPHLFHVRHPETFRHDKSAVNHGWTSGIGNGIQAIKYYAIDTYQNHHGTDQETLQRSIENNVLLNDINFFHTEGLVESWPKDRTVVDREHKTVSCPDRGTIKYDYIIDGGPERPRLPKIISVVDAVLPASRVASCCGDGGGRSDDDDNTNMTNNNSINARDSSRQNYCYR